MTSYHSDLDSEEVSDDDNEEDVEEGVSSAREEKIKEARLAYYVKLARKANIPPEEQVKDAPVWEKRKKAFRSAKVS